MQPFLDEHLKDGAPKADTPPACVFETGTNVRGSFIPGARRVSSICRWSESAEGTARLALPEKFMPQIDQFLRWRVTIMGLQPAGHTYGRAAAARYSRAIPPSQRP